MRGVSISPVSHGGIRTSQVPGKPNCVHAMFFGPRRDSQARPMQLTCSAFRFVKNVGSREMYFEAQ